MGGCLRRLVKGVLAVVLLALVVEAGLIALAAMVRQPPAGSAINPLTLAMTPVVVASAPAAAAASPHLPAPVPSAAAAVLLLPSPPPTPPAGQGHQPLSGSLAPARSVVTPLGAWSGYVVGGGPFTMVTGTFSVPNLAPSPANAAIAEWVGIDGWQGVKSLIQAGVWETYDASTGVVDILPWWEILPAPVQRITTMSVSPGQDVSVTIWQMTPTVWGIALTNDTTDQQFTIERAYSGPQATADWVVEAPVNLSAAAQYPLGLYTPAVTFSGVGVNGSQTAVDPIQIVSAGVPLSVPSALSPDGRSFSVAYGAAPPVPGPSCAGTDRHAAGQIAFGTSIDMSSLTLSCVSAAFPVGSTFAWRAQFAGPVTPGTLVVDVTRTGRAGSGATVVSQPEPITGSGASAYGAQADPGFLARLGPGTYLMRLLGADNAVLAEGRFAVTP